MSEPTPTVKQRKFAPRAEPVIMLAPIVGLVAGLAAIAFQVMCIGLQHFALWRFTGYEPGGPNNELTLYEMFSTIHHVEYEFRPWMLLIVPAIGGLISGFIVYTFAPEAQGHGTDAAINAYHNKRGIIRTRVPIIKMLASAFTLGTGGSGGREGPIAQIGAGCGSWLGNKLKLSDPDRRSLMVAGIGAGIGAIFHAPLAGAIFAVEVLYRDPDFEAEALIPSFIATTVAYCVYSVAFGFQSLFTVAPMMFDSPWLLMPLTILAITMAMASLLYVRCFYTVEALFRRLPVSNYFKPAIGAGLMGVLVVGMFYGLKILGYTPESQRQSLAVLSDGYGFLQAVLHRPATGSPPLITILLIVGLGKMLTTALTIGSGGSGGVFAPSMVIGGSLGAVVALILQQILGDETIRVDVFAILGMASFFAAAANTPVSSLIIVSEMTGSYTLLLPAMWVCALAYLVGRRWSIFSEQVENRRESPAHRGDFIIDVLEGLTVHDALGQMTRNFVTVPLDLPLRQMDKLITDTRQSCFPVVDGQNKYYGVFSLNDIRQFLYDAPLAELAVAEDLATTESQPLTLQMTLSSAIGLFALGRFEELPVVDESDPQTVIGLLRRQDLIASYNARLLQIRSEQNA